jgi:hypothetical protein
MMVDPLRVIDAARAALGRKQVQLREKLRSADDLGRRVAALETEAASARRESQALAARVNEAEEQAFRDGYRRVADEVVSWARRQPRDSRSGALLADRLVEWGHGHADRD